MAKYPAAVRASLRVVTKWLFLDVGLWGVLAWYLGEVLPSEFGTTRPCTTFYGRSSRSASRALCAVLKSNAYEPSCADADALLETFHLGERLGHFGGELSGGMRRKLSTPARFVAAPGSSSWTSRRRASILSRKELWDVLEQEKAERTLR
ncbi:ATPase [Aureococcus anophagefferens]|nr:ATPase [Aureococcus anophagefferens]